ncbi:MAG: hypothetical protein JW940_07080 [Polyangiaceae bacterium]|nr:hypothetical protein [Polyangiaceae bacterium]
MNRQSRHVLVGGIAGTLASAALTACTPTDWMGDGPLPATCNDRIKNGDETDVDCGGPSCKQCVIGERCRTSSDCASGDCSGEICREPHCSNLMQDQDEEAVDCGGMDCWPCAGNDECANGKRDENETDVDCGGPSGCDRCRNGSRCKSHDDCLSNRCEGGLCKPYVIGAGGASTQGGACSEGGHGEAGSTETGARDAPEAGAPNVATGGDSSASGGSSPSSAGSNSNGGAEPTAAAGAETGGKSSTGGRSTSTGGALVDEESPNSAGGSKQGGGTGSLDGTRGGRGGTGATTGGAPATGGAETGGSHTGGSHTGDAQTAGADTAGAQTAGAGAAGSAGAAAAGGSAGGMEAGGAAAGGSSGEAGACSHRTAPTDGVITDFSEFETDIRWTTGNELWGDSDLSGKTFLYPSSIEVTAAITAGGSLELSSSVPFGNFVGFVLAFNASYDASRFAGLSFTVGGNLAPAALDVSLRTSHTTPIGSTCGECEYTSEATMWSDCMLNTKTLTDITTSPGTVQFAWSDFTGGKPFSPVDPTELVGIQLQFWCGTASGCAIDVTFDDFSFYGAR